MSDGERKTLAEIGQKLGKKALEDVATIVKPDTILPWHRRLVAQKFDGSQQRQVLGRPKIDQELEALVVRMAQENRSWGYDRMVGALAHLGYTISDQTVGNILKRHGITPAPERKTTTTWEAFLRTHLDVLVATDFFTAEVWTLSGLVTYSVLFFIHLGGRPAGFPRSQVGEGEDAICATPAGMISIWDQPLVLSPMSENHKEGTDHERFDRVGPRFPRTSPGSPAGVHEDAAGASRRIGRLRGRL